MADSTLSALTAASTLDGTELHYVTQGGADRKATGAQIASYAASTAVAVSALTATWSSSGTTYSGIDLDITDTASAAGSWIFRFHKGGTTYFGMRRDGAIQFAGTFFSLNIPDSTATGGNARGNGAIDIQTTRSGATQVASGLNATLLGSFCTASGDRSTALGYGAAASSTDSIALGFSTTVSGPSSAAIGILHSVSGTGCLAVGYEATDRGLSYTLEQGGNIFATRGDNQTGNYNLSVITTTATPAVATSNRAAAAATNQVALPNNSCYFFEARIAAHRTDATGDHAAFVVTGCIARDATAASTALVGTPAVTVVGRVDSTWTVSATADTTNGALAITVTGAAGKTIRWGAFVRTVEVTS